jgi:serine-type D-Ala-D-Ala carboxypeptidase/endopeptidase (penicillin-binding protein 4)
VSEPGAPLTRRAAREGSARTPGPSRGARPARTGPSGESAPTGFGAVVARHPAAWLASTLGVVFLLLGTGAVLAGAAVGNATPGAAPTASNTAQAGRETPPNVPGASHLRTCSIAGNAADPLLANFSGAVMNATTGELLFDRGASVGVRDGSVSELLTAAAALSILGPDYQIPTRVFDGGAPGTIVLVGGGDPTLSQLPAGEDSVYAGAPKLDDLADRVQTQYDLLHPGVPITQIVLDATFWNASDKWDASWKRRAQTAGFLSEVTALQVDGDRANPKAQVSPRSTDPVSRAGQLFEDAMGLDGVTFSVGSAIASKPVLGEVKSQPMSTLINQMLLTSDATLAETLARVTSKAMGFNGSAASLQQAIPSALAIYEIETSDLTIQDGSGLSELNSIPPEVMADFLIKIANGGNDLNYVYNSLSIAGKTGTLAGRFTAANAVARNKVLAKTGWPDGDYSLAGIITAADGTQLSFAFSAVRDGIKDNTKAALDTITTAVYNCGNNLANN